MFFSDKSCYKSKATTFVLSNIFRYLAPFWSYSGLRNTSRKLCAVLRNRLFLVVCDFFFFLSVYSITLERLNQSKKKFHTRILTEIAQPCTKMGITGHMWPPLIGGFCPTPWNFTCLRFEPIQTKFSYMTFDWNSSSEFENGHQRSNVTPPNRGFLPPRKSNFFFSFLSVDTITLERLNQSEPNSYTWLLTGIARARKLTYLRFQPIQTKFSHLTFDWNTSSKFENGHHRSNIAPLIGGFCPQKIQIPPILMKFKP